MGQVRPGDPIAGFSAAQFNRMMDGAELAFKLAAERGVGVPQSNDQSIVRIKNSTGGNLPDRSIVGIDDVVFNEEQNEEEYKYRVTLTGVTPEEADHTGHFAVLLGPIKAGAIGNALTIGVISCTVNIEDASHKFADVADGEAGHLKSAETGYARILRKPAGTGTGEQLCIVRLAGGGGDCTCLDVWEIQINGIATSGTFVLGVSIDPDGSGPTTAENCTFNWDDTAAEVKTTLAGTHSLIATSDINTKDGPFPNVAIYVVFLSTGTLNRTQPLPTIVTNSLVGTAPIVKVARMTSVDWEA